MSGEASIEESGRLHELLNSDESLQQRYEILKQFWNSSQTNSVDTGDDEAQIARILKKAQEADDKSTQQHRLRRKRRIRRRVQLFVGFAVLLCGAALFYFSLERSTNEKATSKAQPEKLQQLVAQKGSRSKTILPDGSVVWLNAGSNLSYAGKFTGTKREVYLNGEAFFDVVKQPDRPFIVHANGIDIKVLGTSFDVKSYSDEKKVEATLIRGLIQITQPGKNNRKPVYLHPNEKLVIDLEVVETPVKNTTQSTPATPAFTLYRLDSNLKTENRLETAWVYDRLQFRGENFEELARKLERWYNVTIIFQDEEVKQLSFNGSFENETVEQAFAALKAAVPFDYSIKEHEIFITSEKKSCALISETTQGMLKPSPAVQVNLTASNPLMIVS
jgi:ferric-dicitrate binding protein FerR (iron transport regulator)